ncbi:MAG: hypothetical protein HBSAPP02_25360 [Phycisphaerae bacterium]|nr:MAG: YidC/Oxa1 family insertase periplasmic-domain containing protein [Planctomycetia bacterium]GJQ27504.1 MAG: hypothetical protein HBSAPP02_25360 [Phycisphaerae bacterium]
MDAQGKRTLLAMVICLAILMGWSKLMEIWYPLPPRSTTSTSAATSQDALTTNGPAAADGDPTRSMTASAPTGAPPSATIAPAAESAKAGYIVVEAPQGGLITIGDDHSRVAKSESRNPFACSITVDARGAAMAFARLADYRNTVPRNRKRPDHDPYRLLTMIENATTGQTLTSFAARTLKLVDDNATIDLERVQWAAERRTDNTGESVILSTTVRQAGADVLKLRKMYRLEHDSLLVRVRYEIENASSRDRRIVWVENGPIGVKQIDSQHEDRRVVTALKDASGQITSGPVVMRAEVHKEGDEKELVAGEKQFIWAAVSNKYFTALLAPVSADGSRDKPGTLSKLVARSPMGEGDGLDDLTFEVTYSPASPIRAGATHTFETDIYIGPKSARVINSVPGAEPRKFELINAPDASMCTFAVLRAAMLWLLNHTYRIVGNYGIAIIVLVLIVRTILHPISKRGQINMMKMQKGMAALKPKLEALQQQFKNDKQKLNEETMKLYREEGINPAGQMLGCLPMFLQMPVWVALWTTLNTNIDMRHEPFFGWIRDLSAPDALIPFSGTYHIPLLGTMMGPIHAFNLLPIIMTITMYAQQKIMQKMTQPAVPPAPKYDEQGRVIPDPMVQQQKIMNFMMIFFGFIFYNFPSGLNLYILTSNILGMAEQIYIKKQLKRRDERGDFDLKPVGPQTPRKPSFFQRMQERAEEMRKLQAERPQSMEPKKRKKSRF